MVSYGSLMVNGLHSRTSKGNLWLIFGMYVVPDSLVKAI
jgi:hypothetical protein